MLNTSVPTIQGVFSRIQLPFIIVNNPSPSRRGWMGLMKTQHFSTSWNLSHKPPQCEERSLPPRPLLGLPHQVHPVSRSNPLLSLRPRQPHQSSLPFHSLAGTRKNTSYNLLESTDTKIMTVAAIYKAISSPVNPVMMELLLPATE